MSADTNGWRPISTAPKSGNILLRINSWVYAGYWNTDRWSGTPQKESIQPTHWQPLPSPESTPPVDAGGNTNFNQVVCWKCHGVACASWLCTNLKCSNYGKSVIQPATPSPTPASVEISQAAREAASCIMTHRDWHGDAAGIILAAIDSVAEPLRGEVEELKEENRKLTSMIRQASVATDSKAHCRWVEMDAEGLRLDLTRCRERFSELEKAIRAEIDAVKGVHVCEGGGPENLAASVAVTIARFQAERDALQTALESKTVEAMTLLGQLQVLRNLAEGGQPMVEAIQGAHDSALTRTDYSLWLPVLRREYEALKAKATQP